MNRFPRELIPWEFYLFDMKINNFSIRYLIKNYFTNIKM